MSLQLLLQYLVLGFETCYTAQTYIGHVHEDMESDPGHNYRIIMCLTHVHHLASLLVVKRNIAVTSLLKGVCAYLCACVHPDSSGP